MADLQSSALNGKKLPQPGSALRRAFTTGLLLVTIGCCDLRKLAKPHNLYLLMTDVGQWAVPNWSTARCSPKQPAFMSLPDYCNVDSKVEPMSLTAIAYQCSVFVCITYPLVVLYVGELFFFFLTYCTYRLWKQILVFISVHLHGPMQCFVEYIIHI